MIYSSSSDDFSIGSFFAAILFSCSFLNIMHDYKMSHSHRGKYTSIYHTVKPHFCTGGIFRPLFKKIQIALKYNDPKEPK